MNNSEPEIKKPRSRKSATAPARKPAATTRKPITMTRQPLAPPQQRKRTAPVRPTPSAAGPFAWLTKLIQIFTSTLLKRRNGPKKLELREIQQLGEKRFVAIVRVGEQKFLIGGAATSVSLLAEIDAGKTTVIAARPLGQEMA